MPTEVKKKVDMRHSIADLAAEDGLVPGQISALLDELGIEHDGASFEADDDTILLVQESAQELKGSKEVPLRHGLTPRDVAIALAVPQNEVQKTLVTRLKVMATLTTALKDDVAEKLVEQFGYTMRWAEAPKPRVEKVATPKNGAQNRPPVVTIMGHVDHGKTSLLDYIRKANVAAREHGGITQHIGAYQVELPEGKITFLDTPGHAAFTNMRARGAQVTDIAILVVAADDGVMPTTKEAIQHAKAANVPIIVAVNKIDRPNANPDRVLQQLPEFDVIPEAFGGQTITVNVSAVTGEGVAQLLEMILLQAEVMDLKADPKKALEGSVIEAKLEKGRGPVATVLVQDGTLHTGDALVVGTTYGRIKAMTDYLGERINDAGPSTPVEILGLSAVPQAGDKVEFQPDERSARSIAEERADADRAKNLVVKSRGLTLSQFRSLMQEEGLKALNLIIKADVQGSVEAVKGMLEKVRNEEVETKIILSGVGGITKADVDLAAASEAIIVGFNVKPDGEAKKEAERRKVEIRTYTIIYELIEDIEAAAKGMLEPKFEEEFLGIAEIRVRFQFSKKGIIAGSYVTEGKITRNAQCRVQRGKEQVYEGKIASLRHLKDDVREVTMGMECGIMFEDWTDFQEGDTVEAYQMIQVNA
ncbi:MAG TPA: translation initiation factor IF-2 [Fimbriimonas sp.]|nr:translation initiation factor IF-2 [Fimbriimonas sp.]